MKKISFLALAAFGILFMNGCKKDEAPTTGNLSLAITGLEDLGTDYAYESWLMVDGTPVSAGIFNVDADGKLSETVFDVELSNLDAATAYILTIEPSPDSDPSPSATHILAGDFSTGTADLSVAHSAALGTDFASAKGGYIIATPTDDDATNENSGVWFLDPTAGPGASLDLPTLPAGWAYEGWAVIDGSPVSTGTFLSAAGSDDSGKFSGMNASPPFPGEDFLTAAPTGFTFPTDLASTTIVVSVEPSPDNSENPFLLKPLVGSVPATVVNGTVYDMNLNNSTNPSGTASR